MFHESTAQTQLRMATASALDQQPRDPRFYAPDREAKWKNASPLWSRYIPEYGLTNDVTCVGQSEEQPPTRWPNGTKQRQSAQTSTPNAAFQRRLEPFGRKAIHKQQTINFDNVYIN